MVSCQLNTDRKVIHKAFIKFDKRVENSPTEGEQPPHKKQGKSQHLKPTNREVRDLASEASQGPADFGIKPNTHHRHPQPAAIGIDGV